MGLSPLRFSQLLLCLQLLNSHVDITSAAESTAGGLRIRELQAEEIDTPSQTLVGGYTADADQFPFFTLFANGECAGTLISPTRVLTAAHCVQSGHPDTVRIGASTRTDGRERRVRCAKSHPLYDWPNFQYDLAILKLDDAINDVSLPVLNSDTSYPAFDGETLTVIGMGRNSTAGTVADELQRLDYGFVSDAQCKATYGDSVTLGLHICAKGIREGACFGDAGAPLFDNIFGELIGVVTGANGGCADNKVEDVYADVAAFKAWIDSEMEDETCDEECVGCLCEAYHRISTFATTLSTSVRGFFDF